MKSNAQKLIDLQLLKDYIAQFEDGLITEKELNKKIRELTN